MLYVILESALLLALLKFLQEINKRITSHLSKTSVSTLEMTKGVVYSINIKIAL
jgi:hypothetical protein